MASCLTLTGFYSIPLKFVLVSVFDLILCLFSGSLNVSFSSVWLVRKLRKTRESKVMNNFCLAWLSSGFLSLGIILIMSDLIFRILFLSISSIATTEP